MKTKLDLEKKEALEKYKEAKQAYMNDMSQKNWIAYCDKKKACMLLGVII